MTFWTPPSVGRELVDERRSYEGELARQVAHGGEIGRQLKDIDPSVELVFAPESATAPGLTPGRWHLMRRNDQAPPTLMALETPEGGYLEPGSYMVELIQRADLWSERASHERRRAQRRLDEAKVREVAREREERLYEIRQRLESQGRLSVLVP